MAMSVSKDHPPGLFEATCRHVECHVLHIAGLLVLYSTDYCMATSVPPRYHRDRGDFPRSRPSTTGSIAHAFLTTPNGHCPCQP